MLRSAFLDFLFLQLHAHRGRHLPVLCLSTAVMAILAAVMLLAAAVERDTVATLDGQADLVVQRMRAGRAVDLPADWAAGLRAIPGVTAAAPRVYGSYYHEPNGVRFTVVGLDPFDVQTGRVLQELVADLDVRAFLRGQDMIVGPGVARLLGRLHYGSRYEFRTPTGETVTVAVRDTFPAASAVVSNDLAVMEMDLARRVLGIAPDMATDIALAVPNDLETDAVMAKAIGLHYDIRVIQKREIAGAYARLFHFRGGLFLLLALVMLAAFMLLLYQRYALITGAERREIGILRAVGWSIGDVMTLKAAEALVLALAAYLLGVLLAWGYVFGLGAPLLLQAFIGAGGLPAGYALAPVADPGLLALLALLFVLPFLAAVLVPVWRLGVIDPQEAMK